MRSPPETYFDLHNPQQVPSIPYPPFLNSNFSFPTLQPFLAVFLHVHSISSLTSLTLLPLVRFLCFDHLLGISNFLHFLNSVGIFKRSPKSRDGRSCGNGTYDLSRKYGSTRRHMSATVWGSGAHDGNRGALG